jgi:hypothetical protein
MTGTFRVDDRHIDWALFARFGDLPGDAGNVNRTVTLGDFQRGLDKQNARRAA